MKGGSILYTPITQTKLQVAEAGHEAAHTTRLLQVQQTVTKLHLFVDFAELRFQCSQQVVKLDLLEDRSAVLGITPPPRKCVTLKVTHNEAQSGAASAQAYRVHVLAHLEQEVVHFRLLSGES